MSLIFNNLIINKNSKKYIPFLLNLVSGRRRALNKNEYEHILSILDKTSILDFTDEETSLYEALTKEKQFFDNQQRGILEKQILDSGYFKENNNKNKDSCLSICLTQDCNMHCTFCFERGYADKKLQMSKKNIDAIFDFCKSQKEIAADSAFPSIIRITGGEPLINQDGVDLVNYIANKWPSSKIVLLPMAVI